MQGPKGWQAQSVTGPNGSSSLSPSLLLHLTSSPPQRNALHRLSLQHDQEPRPCARWLPSQVQRREHRQRRLPSFRRRRLQLETEWSWRNGLGLLQLGDDLPRPDASSFVVGSSTRFGHLSLTFRTSSNRTLLTSAIPSLPSPFAACLVRPPSRRHPPRSPPRQRLLFPPSSSSSPHGPRRSRWSLSSRWNPPPPQHQFQRPARGD